MDYSLGDRVWVKRNSGRWWPAVVAELASPSDESKRKRSSKSGVTVNYPFEEASEVVPDRRRIKNFDCPECEQLSTPQGSERSSRRRSSLDQDSFQRALAAVTGNSTKVATDTMVDQENVNPKLSPHKSVILDSPRISDIGTKRALFCSDLPDIEPSKRIRRSGSGPLGRARRNNFSMAASPLCHSETSVETNDSLISETNTSLDNTSLVNTSVEQTSLVNVSPTGRKSPGVRMSTRSTNKLRCVFSTSVQVTPIKTNEETPETKDQTVNLDLHPGSSVEQSRDCTGPDPVTSECRPLPNASPSGDCVEDSDDDELPVFSSQSPSKYQGANFQSGDIVWAKCLSFPPWPAVVRNVYKKRGKLEKISVFFIGDEFRSEQAGFRFKYHPKKIKHFCTEEGHTLERRDNPAVMAVVTMVDDYLVKKALGKTQRNPFDHFKIAEEEVLSGVDDDVTFDDVPSVRLDDVTVSSDENSVAEDGDDEETGLKMPDSVVDELKRGATRTQKLVDFIRTAECEEYARAIIRGTRLSRLHNEFDPDDGCTFGSFGPIQDDDQSFEVYCILMNICNNEKYRTIGQRHAYVYKVLAPETIVFAMRRCNHCAESRAWTVFNNGPSCSRALLQYQHDSIIASAERIPEKERIRHRQLQAGRYQRLMEKFERS